LNYDDMFRDFMRGGCEGSIQLSMGNTPNYVHSEFSLALTSGFLKLSFCIEIHHATWSDTGREIATRVFAYKTSYKGRLTSSLVEFSKMAIRLLPFLLAAIVSLGANAADRYAVELDAP